MRLISALLLLSAAGAAQTPRIMFTKQFPGSKPPYVSVSLTKSGVLEYKEAVDDQMPVKTHLPETDVARLFDSADKLNHFQTPLESGAKVANTGRKTFTYEDEAGKRFDTTFNYSTNPDAQQLLERFEEIAESERAYIDLERTARFDKLGVNDALAEIEALWLHKQLAAPLQFVPLLKQISSHESYMHLVRERAARLKTAFELPSPSAQAGNPKQ
jgi:hypothetical protein